MAQLAQRLLEADDERGDIAATMLAALAEVIRHQEWRDVLSRQGLGWLATSRVATSTDGDAVRVEVTLPNPEGTHPLDRCRWTDARKYGFTMRFDPDEDARVPDFE